VRAQTTSGSQSAAQDAGTHHPQVGCLSILSLGKLTISSPVQTEENDNIYRVDQDILHARVDTKLRLGAAAVHLRSWTADGVNTFVTEATAKGGGVAGTPIRVSLEMPAPGPGASTNFPVAVGNQNGVLWATRENGATGSQDYKARSSRRRHPRDKIHPCALGVQHCGSQFRA
jgi:hypothetical protein